MDLGTSGACSDIQERYLKYGVDGTKVGSKGFFSSSARMRDMIPTTTCECNYLIRKIILLTACMHWRDARMTTEGFNFDSNVDRSLLSHTQARYKRTIILRYSSEPFINKKRDALCAISILQDSGDRA